MCGVADEGDGAVQNERAWPELQSKHTAERDRQKTMSLAVLLLRANDNKTGYSEL